MPVETDADRLVFLDDDEYAVVATWTSTGGPASLPVIFDAEYQLLTAPLIDGGAEGAGPQIVCRSSDLPADAAQGDTVALGSASYLAVELQPDGTGMTTVRLQEA